MLRATAWLCEANDRDINNGTGDGYAAITKRILKARAGISKDSDPDWVRQAPPVAGCTPWMPKRNLILIYVVSCDPEDFRSEYAHG